MRTAVVVLVQVLISLAIAGLAMPVILASSSSFHDYTTGPWLAVAIAVCAFVVLRVAWPKSLR